jgi:F-type H+-transporting ATPase subunit b
MSNEKNSSSGNPLVSIAIGVVLMVVGVYLQNAETFKAVEEPLAKSGVPLELGMTIATVGVFLILFKVIQPFFITPLADAINNRTTELENTFSEAESLRNEMAAMRSEYEKKLAATEADARAKIQAQIAEAQQLRQSVMSEATERADQLVARAQQEIQSEKAKVIIELRTSVVDLALAAAEKVLEENMNTDRNRKLVEDFISKVEVGR